MTKRLIFIFHLMLFSFSGFCQTWYEQGWEKEFKFSLANKVYSINSIAGGGYLLAGITDQMTGESSSILVIMIDNMGNIIWNKSHKLKGSYSFRAITEAPGGEYVLLAMTESEGNNIWIFRIDGKGEIVMQKETGTDQKDAGNDLFVTPAGEILLCGAKEIQGDHDTDGWLVQFDKRGKIVWQGLYGKRYIDDVIKTIIPNPKGGYYIGGLTREHINQPVIPYIISIDGRGKTIWEKTFPEMQHLQVESLYIDKEGFLVAVAPKITDQDNMVEAIGFLKLNQAGILLNSHIINEPIKGSRPAYSIVNNNLILLHERQPGKPGIQDAVIERLDENFAPLWNKYFDRKDIHLEAITAVGGNNYVTAGWTASENSFKSDAIVFTFQDNSDKLVEDYITGKLPEWNNKRENESQADYEARMKKSRDEITQYLMAEARIELGMLERQAYLASKEQAKPAAESPMVFRSNNNNLLTGTYHALLIAVNDYDDPTITDLDQPIADAQKLYDVLVNEYLFEKVNVTLLKNPTRAEIIDALDRMEAMIRETDNLLVFYAGHGYWNKETEKGYWLPADASQFSTANWIENSSVSGYIRGIKSKHTLLIADACFGGSIFKTRSAFGSANVAIARLNELPSRKAMTSGTLKEVPDKSIFVEYLVKRLHENTDQYLPSEQLFFSFKPAVLNNSENIPQYGEVKGAGDEGGDFIFIRRQ